MVVLRGNVRDAKKSTESQDVYISGAVLTQGSGWSVVTNESGYFYTSANVILDLLSVNADGYKNSTISIPKFATRYDGSVVISGSLTDGVSMIGELSYITDSVKSFTPDILSGRIFTMMNGVDDGKTGIIVGNTAKIVVVGGQSGGGIGPTCLTSQAEYGLLFDHQYTVLHDGSIITAGGYTGTKYPPIVWKSVNKGANWTCLTSSASWSSGRRYAGLVSRFDGANDIVVLIGGRNDWNYPKDVWKSTDGITWTAQTSNLVMKSPDAALITTSGNIICAGLSNAIWKSTNDGVTWTCQTSSAVWMGTEGRYSPTMVPLSDNSILLFGGQNLVDYSYMRDVWRSTDDGATWLCQTSTTEWEGRAGCAGVEGSGNIVFMVGGQPGSAEIWKSVDMGATWSCVTSNATWGDRYNSKVCGLRDGSILMVGDGFQQDAWNYTVNWNSGSIITTAASGDVYNIGGVSSEPTDHIVVTMWDVNAYPGGYSDNI
jgi:hypothetical protein